ncbi:zinc-binding alcohol dehydrogenase [Asanoa ishikariensis]|uniref:5-exo-hydroxycamphor dehydrogenase n=1 Tax=Asanoa ishikariensis TaxID=137265 RepID=A0A1H3NMC9_9ACTN|nr:zinc-binding dehydrogenase [Asanoa ishikariensis]GIF68511.1 zinc-binding alcohol dehydrogenase [Asanoa ishikariensis]SDY90066.1 5-exo-hydroxycamphor dehydrogenase [Asanoa ishikariensis]
MRTVKRAVLVKPGAPLEIWERPTPSASGREVIVSVEMSGVCGTDHHLQSGDITLPNPMVLGHEAIGRIAELGPEVTTDSAGEPVAVGDLVYWQPAQPCYRCYYCTVVEDVSMCPNLVTFQLHQHADKPPVGTYAQYAWLPDRTAFFKVPADVPAEALIAFGCAMPTVLHALNRLGGIRYGQHVLVQGSGPVGLAATLLAHLAGASSVTVLGAPPNRLEMATKLGATTTIDVTRTDERSRAEAVKEITDGRGADVIIEAAGRVPAFTEGLPLVAPDGSYVIIGLWSAPGTSPVEPRYLNNHNIRVIGSAYTTPRHMYETLQVTRAVHRRYPLAEMVTHRFALDEAQAAIDAVGRGEPLKAVILP